MDTFYILLHHEKNYLIFWLCITTLLKSRTGMIEYLGEMSNTEVMLILEYRFLYSLDILLSKETKMDTFKICNGMQ